MKCIFVGLAVTLLGGVLPFARAQEWTCAEHLLMEMATATVWPQCTNGYCDDDVLRYFAVLPPNVAAEAKIAFIAPLRSGEYLHPQASLFPVQGWHYHAVLLYRGRIIDPAFSGTGTDWRSYLRQMFHPDDLPRMGLWLATLDEVLAAKNKKGWLYLFSEILQKKPWFAPADGSVSPPTVVQRLRLQPGDRLRAWVWSTPQQDWPDGMLQCVEGRLISASARSFKLARTPGGEVMELAYESVTELQSKGTQVSVSTLKEAPRQRRSQSRCPSSRSLRDFFPAWLRFPSRSI